MICGKLAKKYMKTRLGKYWFVCRSLCRHGCSRCGRLQQALVPGGFQCGADHRRQGTKMHLRLEDTIVITATGSETLPAIAGGSGRHL